jgi:nitroreductase
MRHGFAYVVIWMWPLLAVGADSAPPKAERLPAPQMDGGRPLMEVLRDRKSTREFSTRPLNREQLANLLWAGFGVNRPETGQRTAPSTMNLRCIDIYVVTADGACRYDAERHALIAVTREDLRTLTGGQDYTKTAPLALVYVADHAKFSKVAADERDFYAAADAGFIGQNVYLYCASESLGCVVHMPGDRSALSQKLNLRPDQKIVLVHAVGHPAK